MHFEKKKIFFWTPAVRSIFTLMKDTHLDNSIPRYHLFDNNYNHEYIHLYSWYFKGNLKSLFHKLRNFSELRTIFAWLTVFPPQPLWPRMPLWYVVWMCKSYLLTKGHSGSQGGGGHTPNEIQDINETSCNKPTFLSKINSACAVTLDPFVDIVKRLCGR